MPPSITSMMSQNQLISQGSLFFNWLSRFPQMSQARTNFVPTATIHCNVRPSVCRAEESRYCTYGKLVHIVCQGGE